MVLTFPVLTFLFKTGGRYTNIYLPDDKIQTWTKVRFSVRLLQIHVIIINYTE